MRRAIVSAVNRAARFLKASAYGCVPPPSCVSTSPPSATAWQQPFHRAPHGLAAGIRDARHGKPSAAVVPCPHRSGTARGLAAASAARLARHEGCRTPAAAALLRISAINGEAGFVEAHRTAWQAGLRTSAAVHDDDDDRGRRGDLQSEAHVADQHQKPSPTTGGASVSSEDGGAP